MGTWADLTTDHATGHTVAKDFFKAVAFVVGLSLVVAAALADAVAGRPVSLEGAVLLLSYAFALGASKAVEGYYNRRTADNNNHPLAQPGTSEAPQEPVLMPQVSP